MNTPLVIVHLNERGDLDFFIAENGTPLRVLTVDERVPADRTYEQTNRCTVAEAMRVACPEALWGNQNDETHKDLIKNIRTPPQDSTK